MSTAAAAAEVNYRAIPDEIESFRGRAFIIGIIALVLASIGAFVEVPVLGGGPRQFFHSYLLGFVFWIGVALGCLALLMVQNLAGGAWGLVIRRLLEASTRTLPWMLLFFVPIVVGAPFLYEWTHTEAVAQNELLRLKSNYLNIPFFVVRAVLYFAIWSGLTYFLNKWSAQQDETTADPRLAGRLQMLSGPGLVLFALTVTFAAVDWVMSLDPEWYSTIFGILFMGGWALSALAFIIAMAVLLSNYEPLRSVLAPAHFHDLGKLLLAFVMLWAYFNLSQFLIIWSGNLPEEIPWYIRRLRGGWQFIGLGLVVLHFALPFLLLLSRDLKRNSRMLSRVAVLVIIMRFIDSFWLIAPQFNKEAGLRVSWLDIVAPIGIGGIWLALFMWNLKQLPLIPVGDPGMEQAIARGHAHGGH